ncbi:MAG: HAMP domain-containing histidine kinase [Bacteroidaceae bacterium]|nr:HAMP domain-containing histidine kinase [Bacteroidaceae bacterium]
MKKTFVWILGGVMCVSFLLLLSLQFRYMQEMSSMRQRQFDEAVKRSLYEVAHKLELEEARRYVEEDIRAMERNRDSQQSVEGYFSQTQSFVFQNGSFSFSHSIQTGTDDSSNPSQSMPSLQMPRSPRQESSSLSVSDRLKGIQQEQLENYVANRFLVDEVIYSMMSNTRPRARRIDYSLLAEELNDQLKNNGIDLAFHYAVTTPSGRVLHTCGCKDYDSQATDNTYSQTVFKNDNPSRMYVVKVHFPTLDEYIDNSVNFILPSIVFIVILMVTFCVVLFIVLRQRKVTEIKNDFINNMTHEFKTPISTISLAAQMLGDPSVVKSEQMFKHISGVIADETRRLRFQVEKVLQMSMFERSSNTMKLKETDVDELINGVVSTFRLRVGNVGGSIDASFETTDPFAMVDEMHFTNVIYNLMDNAVKYKRDDIPLHLELKTWNEPGKLMVSVADNGIGIKREDLKKIFEKFYRVHTGNRHDVKGFGLGLAYVKKVILNHKGQICAESELGNGTRFIITLPHKDD